MAHPEGTKTRPKTQNQNWTQFDRELIGAARDKRRIRLCFTLGALLHGDCEMEAIVEVVDRYMVKLIPTGGVVEDGMSNDPVWIQKHLIAGVVIEAS